MKILLWLVLAPILIIVLGFAGTEINKTYWDRRISNLCAEDGGAHVTEKIIISLREAERLPRAAGFIALAPRSLSENVPAYKVEDEEVIKESNPRIIKRIERVIRAADGIETGQLISYSRIGGDFPTGLGAPTSYTCPKNPDYYAVQETFFSIQGDE